jgi:hypothetical protein
MLEDFLALGKFFPHMDPKSFQANRLNSYSEKIVGKASPGSSC